MIRPKVAPPTVALFVPGNRPERFAKAADSGASAIILDLEDAVAPEEKALARAHVLAYAQHNPGVIVRTNACTTPWFAQDLAALAGLPLTAIMLPKAEAAGALESHFVSLAWRVPVVPLIESAIGMANLPALLNAPGTWFASFGSFDLALDLGCAHSWEPLLHARSQLVLHSRAAGLPPPLDGVTATLDDPDLVEREARRSAELGFGGKLAIHPKQVEPIARGFAPDAATRAWAERVVAAARASASAAQIDGAMIDRPIVERAYRLLGLARELREVDTNATQSTTDSGSKT